MHCSTKPPCINSKVKNRYNQVPPPYNAGIHFVSAPNVSNSGQLQLNRKYINNVGNVNEVSVLQYHRTSNLQIKEVNHFQNLRHQQQQAFVYKNPQFHNHLNPNFQQKLPVTHPVQRKIFNEQTVPANILQPPFKQVEFNSKITKELQNQQEANKLNKNPNIKVVPLTYRKVSPKKATATSSQEESKLPNKETGNVNLKNQHKQVPENVQLAEENNVETSKGHNEADVQQDMEQVLNINSEHSEVDANTDAIDNSTKNAREKTPMCLINDLARFNKISFQYRLTSENGPAHCKRFTVTLKLGDEEYTAEGFKIKKAQHLAAKEAIEKTKYKHPTPKTNRRTDENNASKSNITPTVELNALAMKLGQQTYYIFDPRQMENNSNYRLNSQMLETNKAITQQPTTGAVENLIHSGKQIQTLNYKRQFLPKFQNRYAATFQQPLQNSSTSAVCPYFPPTSPCKITLIVGTKQFVGVGRTLQQAKHDAASNALQVLKEQMRNEQLENHNNDSTEDNDSKSPISLVFEIGIKRNLPVDFKVLREQGPAHMRTFVTACIVGDIVTEGEGTGKKISKKKAAQKMLEELKKLPPLTPAASPVKRVKLKMSKKASGGQPKNINLVEANEAVDKPWHKKAVTESEATNPINKLIEWHQNKKEKEPVFKLICENGKENSRRKQFVMEVSSNNITARGVGSNKKLAKQDAAHNFLMAIAEAEKQPQETAAPENCSSATSTNNNNNNNGEIEKTLDETTTQNILREETCKKLLSNKESCQEEENTVITTTTTNISPTSTAVTATASKEPTNVSSKSKNLYMKDQLIYLAKLLGFDVEFSDYPKGNHNEFLSIVMLSTNPPQICHGFGNNAKESQEDAAKNALKILSEMGLNNAVKA